jgi:hypothetical protein
MTAKDLWRMDLHIRGRLQVLARDVEHCKGHAILQAHFREAWQHFDGCLKQCEQAADAKARLSVAARREWRCQVIAALLFRPCMTVGMFGVCRCFNSSIQYQQRLGFWHALKASQQFMQSICTAVCSALICSVLHLQMLLVPFRLAMEYQGEAHRQQHAAQQLQTAWRKRTKAQRNIMRQAQAARVIQHCWHWHMQRQAGVKQARASHFQRMQTCIECKSRTMAAKNIQVWDDLTFVRQFCTCRHQST